MFSFERSEISVFFILLFLGEVFTLGELTGNSCFLCSCVFFSSSSFSSLISPFFSCARVLSLYTIHHSLLSFLSYSLLDNREEEEDKNKKKDEEGDGSR